MTDLSRSVRQAPESPDTKPKSLSRVARHAPPSPPEQPDAKPPARVAREAKDIIENDDTEDFKPLQIRQDTFYSTVMKISH